MTIVKFTVDRQPRRGAQDNAMTVWQVLLLFIDWVNSNYVKNFAGGIATVVAGTPSIVVNHNLGTVAYRIALTPNGANPTLFWWVSNKTATTFQINLSANAPAGGVAFDWLVKGD